MRWMSSRFGKYAFVVCMALGVSSCMHVKPAKPATAPAAATTVATAAPADIAPVEDLPLSTIIHRDLQTGHYADGEPELRHYLQKHPNDHAAQSLLTQLTGEPTKMLGPPTYTHVVQSGDSYSTLAAQYLGNADLFLILARYNNSSNPSLLRAGATIQLPASAKISGVSSAESSSGPAASDAVATPNTPADESPAQKALRLQTEGTAQYQQGNKPQALSLLDQAMTLDPTVKSSSAETDALRKELVLNYHQRAIVLYRDQHLDEAIALWNRILAMDPSFEPAAIYRARALELKQRLKQF